MDFRPGDYARTGSDWRAVRLQVLARDGWACGYCGHRATSADHIVPLNLGGPRLDPSNLVACCGPCQNRKGDQHRQRA